jgi:DNA-binding NarL/FixJ family response regulator
MNNPRILIMQQDSLLNHALATLINNSECNLKVFTIGENDVRGMIAETSELKPDVVILGESTPLARKDVLGDLLMSNPEMQVITISEDTNWIHIFHKKDKLMTRQSDLLDLLCTG